MEGDLHDAEARLLRGDEQSLVQDRLKPAAGDGARGDGALGRTGAAGRQERKGGPRAPLDDLDASLVVAATRARGVRSARLSLASLRWARSVPVCIVEFMFVFMFVIMSVQRGARRSPRLRGLACGMGAVSRKVQVGLQARWAVWPLARRPYA